ncbi:AMP-binding and AMP-binding C domain containing p rotein [Trichuris trichiura]|uniref:AMP-binding and AMP-binding C domain containing p rotein n=1 Tax=Trichuris trichiura TaxID=36087 RepID=A0A077Z1F7_TRITR|nr:AMP-binding and AMP-binding C domain containing p rotein [Trichuris trichiura]
MPAVFSGDKGFMSLRNLLLPCSFSLPSPVSLDDPATIAFSSGTTGLPKGLLLSHRAVVSSIEIMRRKEYAPPGPSDYIICPLSLIYGYPQYAILHLAMKQGSTVVLMKKFSLEKLLTATNEFQVQPYLPMRSAQVIGTLSIRFAIISVRLTAYGMTECAPATITKQGQSKLGSVGQPAPSMEVKVVNLQSGELCKHCEVGEIWIRGPTRMTAYLHNPEATKETITADGWIKTGDTGYLDDDDHLFVVGRIKELIKYKSKQVAPAELENILLQHPAIKDAAVVGIPKAEVGEVPRAYVCLRSQCTISEEDIHSKLAPHKWLRGGVRFVQNIPHSCNGKVQRKLLKEQAMLESANKNENTFH